MVPNELETINDLLRSKNFEKALFYSDQLLKSEPSSYFGHYLKGLALFNMAEFDKAAECFRASISLRDDHDLAYNYLGITLKRLGDMASSEYQLRMAIELSPQNGGFHQNLGAVLIAQKKYSDAEIVLKRALRLDPRSWRAQYKLGELYEKIGRFDEAVKKYKYLIQKKIKPTIGLLKCADLYRKTGDKALALKFYKKANDLADPGTPIVEHIAMGFIELNEIQIALGLLLKILPSRNYRPDLVSKINDLFQKTQRRDAAKKIIKQAIKVNPKSDQLYLLMGNIYKDQGIYEKATNYYKKVLDINPNIYAAYSNLGNVFIETGNYDASIVALETSLNLNKHWNFAKFNTLVNLGNAELTLGKFKEGWEKYEYRWKVDPGDKVVWPLNNTPMWEGEKDRNVFLWREQGIGDDIIFLGLVPEAYEAAGKSMTVLIDPRLVNICERSMPGIEFLPAGKGTVEEDRFDYHLPMGSLPRLFRNSEKDFNRTKEGYLKADMNRAEILCKELGIEDKKVIGISWKSIGSNLFKKKSMDLAQFGRVFEGLDIVLLNLQYGDVDEEIREFTKSTGIEVLQCSSVNLKEDLDGLAALIELCDLVVSTSNVTIHMAGALGKDSWLLLPFAANFWWLIERTDSLWYPSVKLYRQESLQDWSGVLKSIRLDLDQRFEKL